MYGGVHLGFSSFHYELAYTPKRKSVHHVFLFCYAHNMDGRRVFPISPLRSVTGDINVSNL